MRQSKNILLLMMFLLCGVISYGQFSLGGNGVTIECPGEASGNTGVVGVKTYWAVNVGDITQFINRWISTGTGSFDAGGSTHTPPDLSCVCTSNITDMSTLFEAKSINQDISSWDTSNVTTMSEMFKGADIFDQDISNWDVSNVTNMFSMFNDATVFNKNIGGWNTGSVNNMRTMFYGAQAFNQNIGGWNTGNVTNMWGMFKEADAFNQNIGGWNTGSVSNMDSMFESADDFNNGETTNTGSNPLTWNTSSVTNMQQMFFRGVFNQDISDWNTSSVVNMASMFQLNSDFNNGGVALDCAHAVFGYRSWF